MFDSGYRCLDLYSGAGGVAVGYALAGFEIVGIDIRAQAHYPYDFHQGDAIEFVKEHGHEFDFIHASPPCFAAGTPVLTKRGSLPIEDVRVGDSVWTHMNRWREVRETMSRRSDTVRVGPITTTPEHLFYTRPPVRRWDKTARQTRRFLDAPTWLAANEVQGQFLASPLSVSSDLVDWPVSPWLAGRYMADGWTGRDGVMIAVGRGKEAEFEERSGEKNWVISMSGPSCWRYTTPQHDAAAWLREHFGHGAHSKTIPTFVLGADETTRREVLDGYLSGDGSRTKQGWTANTVSNNLASQLRLLALSLGHNCGIREQVTPDTIVIEGRTVNQSNYWSVFIGRRDGRYTEDLNGLHWFKQRKAVRPGPHTTVYDLTVDEDHSFLAWGYIVHNCQRYSHATVAGHAHKHPDLIGVTREALLAVGKPYVIENVPRAPLLNPLVLCGSMFNLTTTDDDGVLLHLQRHRLFESNMALTAPGPCVHPRDAQWAGSYGGARRDKHEARKIRKGGYVPSKARQQELLGIDWMPERSMYEAIPPAFTAWIGLHVQAELDG